MCCALYGILLRWHAVWRLWDSTFLTLVTAVFNIWEFLCILIRWATVLVLIKQQQPVGRTQAVQQPTVPYACTCLNSFVQSESCRFWLCPKERNGTTVGEEATANPPAAQDLQAPRHPRSPVFAELGTKAGEGPDLGKGKGKGGYLYQIHLEKVILESCLFN